MEVVRLIIISLAALFQVIGWIGLSFTPVISLAYLLYSLFKLDVGFTQSILDSLLYFLSIGASFIFIVLLSWGVMWLMDPKSKG